MNKRLIGGYLLLTAIFLLIFLLTLTPPVFIKLGFDSLAGNVYHAFSPFCHQLDHRSFHIFGEKLGVCARDTGVYLGFFIGAVAYPFFRRLDSDKTPPRWLVIVALLPIALDGGTQLVGLRESNNVLRITTGFLFGAGVAPYLVYTVSQLFREPGG